MKHPENPVGCHSSGFACPVCGDLTPFLGYPKGTDMDSRNYPSPEPHYESSWRRGNHGLVINGRVMRYGPAGSGWRA